MHNDNGRLNIDLDFLDDKNTHSISNETNEKTSTSSAKDLQGSQIRPWVRYFARFIDINLYATILSFFSTSLFSESKLGFGMLVLFLGIFIESILLSSWGTTFGKWLLRVCIRDNEGKILTFPIALQRSFLVWLKGLGAGFPIVSLFTLISAHADLTQKGINTWDRDYQLTVTHNEIGYIRASIAIFLIGIFFLSILIELAG